MNEEKQKILSFSQDHFLSNGFYKTSMDEIARNLKMSKKTIYKHFTSKDELVREVVYSFLKKNRQVIEDIIKSESNAVEKFFLLIQTLGKFMQAAKEKWFADLKYQTPELWKEIDEFRIGIMSKNLKKLIKQGMDEGYFLDQQPDVVAQIFVSAIRGIANPDFIMNNKISAGEAITMTVNILMRGIMTDKGNKEFQKIKNRVLK